MKPQFIKPHSAKHLHTEREVYQGGNEIASVCVLGLCSLTLQEETFPKLNVIKFYVLSAVQELQSVRDQLSDEAARASKLEVHKGSSGQGQKPCSRF